MFTNCEEDLQKIYDEEARKLHANVYKLNILKRLTIEDLPRDLTEASKQNIEKALLAVKIKDHITLENGQKTLGKLMIIWRDADVTLFNFRIRKLRSKQSFAELSRKEAHSRAF
jgi:hypothetical protein